MKPTIFSSGINRRVALSALATVPALSATLLTSSARAQTNPGANSAFSFAVYGDSRWMMYLPYKSAQRDEAIKLMVDMFELVFPEKIAEEVVRKDVKLIYDPAIDELVEVVMPFETKSERRPDRGRWSGHRNRQVIRKQR